MPSIFRRVKDTSRSLRRRCVHAEVRIVLIIVLTLKHSETMLVNMDVSPFVQVVGHCTPLHVYLGGGASWRE